MKLITFLLFLTAWDTFGDSSIDCRTNMLNEIVSSKLINYTKGNHKHADLTSCSLNASNDGKIYIVMDLYALSKDRIKERIGFVRITKTLYSISFTSKLTFSLDINSCTIDLVNEQTEFHSEGVISAAIKGLLDLGSSEIRQFLRKKLNDMLDERVGQFFPFC